MAVQKSDNKKVREMFQIFLRLPLGETAMSPMIVAHPIFDSGTYPIMDEDGNIELLDIYNDNKNCEKAINYVEANILPSVTDIFSALMIIRKPYRLSFLKYCKDFLSKEDFSVALGDVWCTVESASFDKNVSLNELVRWFKKCDKNKLMNKEELSYLDSLPDEVSVYRGIGGNGSNKGLSWTDNYDLAVWFAKRWNTKNGYVIKGKVKKADILAYFSGRAGSVVSENGETELIIAYEDIMDKEMSYL